MTDKNIWIIFTKSKALDGCSIDIDGGEFYFTEVFVPSECIEDNPDSIKEMIGKTKQVLLNERLELTDISKSIRYQEDEWTEDTELNNEIQMTVKESIRSNQIKFNTFRSEEIQQTSRRFVYI